jgi:hypothetical protein
MRSLFRAPATLPARQRFIGLSLIRIPVSRPFMIGMEPRRAVDIISGLYPCGAKIGNSTSPV